MVENLADVRLITNRAVHGAVAVDCVLNNCHYGPR